MDEDEAISKTKEENEIDDEIALIKDIEPIETLNYEYAAQTIQDITSKYRIMRKIRPDGNSFYRAFGFAILEHSINNKDEFKKFRKVIEESKTKLIQLNFPQSTIDELYGVIMEVINKVEPSEANDFDVNNALKELFKLFNQEAYSDAIVKYLRFITSAKLQEEAEFYYEFILGNYESVLGLCKKEVEPMHKESNKIHILAIAEALGSTVRVVYMDRQEITIPACPDTDPSVCLLYRSSGYDILYK